jgi:hypothetical protein
MKRTGYFRFFLPVIMALFPTGNSFCQEVESGYAEIYFNNLPDTKPPSIKILSPVSREDGSYRTEKEEFNVIGEVTDESHIKYVTFDDNLVNINELGIFTVKMKLAPGLNQFRVAASDIKDNLHEEWLTIEYAPPVVSLADKIKKESKYYGLIIGIDEYQDPNLPDLSNPINDANKLYRTLIQNYTFKEPDVTLLRNAKRNDIVIALDELAGKVTQNDNVLIFYAGHGTWDEKANIGYWLPSDAYLNSTINWFRNSTLVDYLKVIDSKHTLLITDACFAGSIFQTRSAQAKQDRAYEVLYDLSSRKAMTSGTLTEVPDRSSFTRFLIERLDDNAEPYLSSEQLFSSFRIAVINNSDAIPQFGEIRNVGDEGGDFIFLKKD